MFLINFRVTLASYPLLYIILIFSGHLFFLSCSLPKELYAIENSKITGAHLFSFFLLSNQCNTNIQKNIIHTTYSFPSIDLKENLVVFDEIKNIYQFDSEVKSSIHLGSFSEIKYIEMYISFEQQISISSSIPLFSGKYPDASIGAYIGNFTNSLDGEIFTVYLRNEFESIIFAWNDARLLNFNHSFHHIILYWENGIYKLAINGLFFGEPDLFSGNYDFYKPPRSSVNMAIGVYQSNPFVDSTYLDGSLGFFFLSERQADVNYIKNRFENKDFLCPRLLTTVIQ